jgi:uncharacterized RDD family membrane protein YckC
MREEDDDQNLWDDPVSDGTEVFQPPKARVVLRFIHFLIDAVTVVVLHYAVLILAIVYYDNTGETHKISSWLLWLLEPLSLLITYIVYVLLIELITRGRTLGKLATGYQVRTLDFQAPTAGQLIGRNLLRLIPFEPLSIFFDKDRRMWHDRWSNTQVVQRVRNRSASEDDIILD